MKKYIQVGYAYNSKVSSELHLVKNQNLHKLPHVFPIYKEIEVDTILDKLLKFLKINT